MTEISIYDRDQACPPVLEVYRLKTYFPVKERKGLFYRTSGYVAAVDDLSFTLHPGETLGLVGESGCGKTTVGKSIVRLVKPTAGQIKLNSRDITSLTGSELRGARREIQMIFQDPYSSLNPRMSAGDIVGEPIENYGLARGKKKSEMVEQLFQRVGFRRAHLKRYPHEFSGGQRQRIGIARALALTPSVIVADEAVSALDVSIQAQIINLLTDLQEEYNLAYLFISHDLAVIKYISHRIAVMYLGQIVEMAKKNDIFSLPAHPYTQALLSAIPIPDPEKKKNESILEGDVPSPIHPPPGCRFHSRCPYVEDICRSQRPPLKEIQPEHWVTCHLD